VTKSCEWAVKELGEYVSSQFNIDMGCGGYTVPMVTQISAAWKGNTGQIPPLVVAGLPGMMWYNQEDWYVLHDNTWMAGVMFQDVSWPVNTKNPPNVTVGLSNGQVWLFNYSSSTDRAGRKPLNLSNLTDGWVHLGTNNYQNAVSGLSVDWGTLALGKSDPLVAIGMNTSTIEYFSHSAGWQPSPADMNGWDSGTWTSVFDSRWVFKECGDQPTVVYGSETGYAGMYTCSPDGAGGCSCVQSFQTKPMGHIESKRIIATQLSVEWSLFASGQCAAPSAVWTFGESDVWMYNGCINSGDMVQVAPGSLSNDKGITQLAVNWEPCLTSGYLQLGDNNCLEIVLGFLTSAVWWLPPNQDDVTSQSDWTQLRPAYKAQAVAQMSVNFQTGGSMPSLVMGLENGQLIANDFSTGEQALRVDTNGACIQRLNVYDNDPLDYPSVVLTTESGYAVFVDGSAGTDTPIHKAFTTSTTETTTAP